MTRPYILLLLFLIANLQCLALDHIILRNGQAFDVKLLQMTDEAATYSLKDNNHEDQKTIPTKDIYMVYIEKQGNVYLTPDGKRITGEAKRVDPKKNDAIYLVSGAEIGAKDIKVTEDGIIYTPINTKKGGILSNITNLIGAPNSGGRRAFSNEEVFMIRYKSGMLDVITPFEKPVETAEEIELIKEEDPQHVVFFHTVTRGQNLSTIAHLFNVTVEQIIKWNNLPAKSKPTAPLTTGKQLTLYLPK